MLHQQLHGFVTTSVPYPRRRYRGLRGRRAGRSAAGLALLWIVRSGIRAPRGFRN